LELLERFVRADVEAFETLFRQHQSEVYGWIVRVVRDRAAAEDLTVETFWPVWRGRARPEEKLPGRCAADPTPDAALSRELRGAITRAFGQLPARLRAAAALALIEERPYSEIAEALGISVEAVKVRVFRAVRLLRKKLQRMGVEP
jgi:RNA polymerase sigma-70 factor (ECF subfamily)